MAHCLPSSPRHLHPSVPTFGFPKGTAATTPSPTHPRARHRLFHGGKRGGWRLKPLHQALCAHFHPAFTDLESPPGLGRDALLKLAPRSPLQSRAVPSPEL